MLGPRSRSEIDFLEKKSENVLNIGTPTFSYLRDIRKMQKTNFGTSGTRIAKICFLKNHRDIGGRGGCGLSHGHLMFDNRCETFAFNLSPDYEIISGFEVNF